MCEQYARTSVPICKGKSVVTPSVFRQIKTEDALRRLHLCDTPHSAFLLLAPNPSDSLPGVVDQTGGAGKKRENDRAMAVYFAYLWKQGRNGSMN